MEKPFSGSTQKIQNYNRKFKILSGILLFLDMAALFFANKVSIPAAAFLQAHVFGRPPYDRWSPDAALHEHIHLVLSTLVLFLLWHKGFYTRRIPWWSQVGYLTKTTVFVFLLHGFANFALKFYESRLLIVTTWTLAFSLLLCSRWLVFAMIARFGWLDRPTVVIGDFLTSVDLLYALSADLCARYDVKTLFLRDPAFKTFDRRYLPGIYRDIPVEDGRCDFGGYVLRHPDIFYVISLDVFRGEAREGLIRALNESGAAHAVVPAMSGLNVYDMQPCYFFGQDITMLEAHPLKPGQQKLGTFLMKGLKRALDIVIAFLALILLLPLLLVIAAALKIEGQGGSIFYGGKRLGYKNREFSCWKFRSMEPDSDHLLQAYLERNPQERKEWEQYRKLKNDPRITTHTARIIRKTSLDELPQLWNVLTGDMSLVGPRPILAEETFYFGDILKDYFSVRPGITGLWQVSGRNETTFNQRVFWDRWYVRNWSFWNDLVILMKTPLVLLSQKGAN